MFTDVLRTDGSIEMKRAKVIRGISWVAGIVALLFMTALDSDTMIPMIVVGICAVWLLLVCIGNTK